VRTTEKAIDDMGARRATVMRDSATPPRATPSFGTLTHFSNCCRAQVFESFEILSPEKAVVMSRWSQMLGARRRRGYSCRAQQGRDPARKICLFFCDFFPVFDLRLPKDGKGRLTNLVDLRQPQVDQEDQMRHCRLLKCLRVTTKRCHEKSRFLHLSPLAAATSRPKCPLVMEVPWRAAARD